VRNPIFTAMVVTAFGLFLWVPNVVSLTAAVLLAGAAQLQVRAVEEPYLRRMHCRAYAEYAAALGRFIPGVGRERDHTVAPPAGPA
jgi:protein-S-isoprenylcysteine O-methyltransferase Ste14